MSKIATVRPLVSNLHSVPQVKRREKESEMKVSLVAFLLLVCVIATAATIPSRYNVNDPQKMVSLIHVGLW